MKNDFDNLDFDIMKNPQDSRKNSIYNLSKSCGFSMMSKSCFSNREIHNFNLYSV